MKLLSLVESTSATENLCLSAMYVRRIAWTRLAEEFELGFKVCSRAGSETLNPKPGPGRNSI